MSAPGEIRTARLVLRLPRYADVVPDVAYINDPGVSSMLGGKPGPTPMTKALLVGVSFQ